MHHESAIARLPVFSIVCDDLTQGMMIVDMVKYRGRINAQKGKHLVYVEFVESAPWNRAELFDPPRYRGVGSILVRAAVTLSEESEFQGRIGLHSLRQANGFYANTCGMTDLGADPDQQGLHYFEMTPEQSQASSRKEVEMKNEISKEWCMLMAQYEGDDEIGAGQFAFDPVFDGEPLPAEARAEENPNVAFGRFVNLMRRQREMSLEQLAENADVDMADLVKIESDPHHKPELRTTYQLANYFKVSRSGLMQVAGLAGAKDSRLFDEGVRFAARSESTAELTPQEVAALEAFVTVLSERT